MRRAVLVLALFGLASRPVRAQALGGNETVAGSALNLVLRGPYVAKAWRRPLPRLVLSQVVSVGYELAIDVNGWSRADVAGRLKGYALTEGLVALVRRVLR
jgi:hypothetical protein